MINSFVKLLKIIILSKSCPENCVGKIVQQFTSKGPMNCFGELPNKFTSEDCPTYYICDAPNPGCPLTTRQPAEIYMSHVMRPIHVQKWPLWPTHHTHKMYILYKMI